MDVSINVGYFGPHITDNHKLIKDLDELGVSCVWTAEAYGYDAVTPLAYFAALTNQIWNWFRNYANSWKNSCNDSNDCCYFR